MKQAENIDRTTVGRTYNERLGKTAAVTPQTRHRNLAKESPAGSESCAATSPSRLDVSRNRAHHIR